MSTSDQSSTQSGCATGTGIFQRNILEPNRNHIQTTMQLSDLLTDRVVDSADYIINDWTGEADHDSDDEFTLSHSNFFTDEDLDF